jgi:(2R)-ethylmalonyl-CoA mutase
MLRCSKIRATVASPDYVQSPMRDQPTRDKALRDKPWIFRTYAGHSTATASNALYRKNLSKGQTGLSVAFDLPTQTGYDSDHPLACCSTASRLAR